MFCVLSLSWAVSAGKTNGDRWADAVLQSVRRKGGRYVYIICSKNPKHKQRSVSLHPWIIYGRDADYLTGKVRSTRIV